jgi:hypothetical protein
MTDKEDVNANVPTDELEIRRAGNLLRSAMPSESFADGFADRTMARLAATRAITPSGVLRIAAMQRSFRVLAAAAAIAIVALGVHNTMIVRVDDTTFVEAAIGLEPVSAEAVLSYTTENLQ